MSGMWSGQYSRAKKQSLSGNRVSTETRQEILERTRRERAERLQSRREDEAALVVQKVWRSWMARRAVRERWLRELLIPSASHVSTRSGPESAQRRRIQVLVAAVDPDVASDVIMLARELKELLDVGLLDGMLAGVVGGAVHVDNACTTVSAAPSSSYMLMRDLFQLCVHCLASHRGECGGLRGATWAELEVRAARAFAGTDGVKGDSGEVLLDAARVLVAFVLKVLRLRRMVFFDVSLQKVCLRRVTWRYAGRPQPVEGGDNSSWTVSVESCVVQDVVDVVDALVPREGERKGISGACVGETLLTAMIVCMFSDSSRPSAMNFEVLRVVMGIESLFQRCPSTVVLAGKIWTSAMECIGQMIGTYDVSAAWRASRALEAATLEQIIPQASLGPLLANLVHGVECMHAQGRLGSASRGSLLCFMALVDLVLGGETQSNLSRSRDQAWHVSAPSFIHPLAEANVMVVMAKTLLADDTGDQSGSAYQVEHRKLELSRVAMTQTLCNFVHRLVGNCGSQMVHTKIILTLAVKANMAGLLWSSCLKTVDPSVLRERPGEVPPASTGPSEPFERWMPTIILFCETFVMSLNVLGDEGFYDRGLPVPIDEVYSGPEGRGSTSVLGLLKALLWPVLWHESQHSDLRRRFLEAGGRLLMLLHDRNGRRPFAPQDAFYASSLPRENFHLAAVAAIAHGAIEEMHVELSGADGLDCSDDELNTLDDARFELMEDDRRGESMDVDGVAVGPRRRTGMSRAMFRRVVDVLRYAYPLIPFLERVRVFQSIVTSERASIGASETTSGVLFGGMSRERFVNVHRGRVLEDAYEVLGQRKSSVDVKKRIRISFVNDFGEQEAGIDGGGMFKEFLESVIRESVSANKGLFMSTTDNKLYPAPTTSLTREQLKLIEFVGMMVGKALWEGFLLDLPLASFFLKKIRGASSGVDDLPSLDPELAKNLSYLARNPDSVAEMGLTFSISTVQSPNSTADVELVPGGKSMPVTGANVAHFIHRVANFKLNEQIQTSCDAFLSGFYTIVPAAWVRSFNDSELQMLIGGAEGDSRLDLVDLQNHVICAGGYDEYQRTHGEHHPTIINLWNVLDGMTNAEQADFLRFVTSCPRPPILGFRHLQPPLTIQMVQSDDRLPTAATCINLLKLPAYGSRDVLRDKLLYAIKSHSGFDLS